MREETDVRCPICKDYRVVSKVTGADDLEGDLTMYTCKCGHQWYKGDE